jgi:hypothetical protein
MGVTQSYLSVVINSDAFRDYFNARRAEHNGSVSKSIIERVEELAGTTLEVLNERIAAERKTVGLSAVSDAAEIALKALGFGAQKQNNGNGNFQQNNVQNVFHIGGASLDTLESARADMRALNGNGGQPLLLNQVTSPALALEALKAFNTPDEHTTEDPTAT